MQLEAKVLISRTVVVFHSIRASSDFTSSTTCLINPKHPKLSQCGRLLCKWNVNDLTFWSRFTCYEDIKWGKVVIMMWYTLYDIPERRTKGKPFRRLLPKRKIGQNPRSKSVILIYLFNSHPIFVLRKVVSTHFKFKQWWGGRCAIHLAYIYVRLYCLSAWCRIDSQLKQMQTIAFCSLLDRSGSKLGEDADQKHPLHIQAHSKSESHKEW